MLKDVEYFKTQVSAELHAANENMFFVKKAEENFKQHGFGIFRIRRLRRVSPSPPFTCFCLSCGKKFIEFHTDKLNRECDQCLSDLFPSNEHGLASAQAMRWYTHAFAIRTGRADFFVRTMYGKYLFIAVATFFLSGLLQSLMGYAIFQLLLVFTIVSAAFVSAVLIKKRDEMTKLFRRQVDGVFLNSPKSILNWLDYYWPATYGYSDLPTRFINLAIMGMVDNFPLLLWFDAILFHKNPKIQIFLSAWVPGVSDVIDFLEDSTPLYSNDSNDSNEAEELKLALNECGFEIQVQEAGILLRATPSAVQDGKKNQRLFFNQLPEKINLLIRLAKAYKCSPTMPKILVA